MQLTYRLSFLKDVTKEELKLLQKEMVNLGEDEENLTLPEASQREK